MKKTMKAQADLIFLIGMLFAIVIAVFVVDNIWIQFKTNPTSQQIFNATPQGRLAETNATTSINIINNAIVMIFIVAALASIIAAAFTSSSPIFIIPALIVLPVEVLFAFIFHDAFFTIIQNSVFSGIATTYPTIITLFQYLPIISFVLAIVMIIVTFTK